VGAVYGGKSELRHMSLFYAKQNQDPLEPAHLETSAIHYIKPEPHTTAHQEFKLQTSNPAKVSSSDFMRQIQAIPFSFSSLIKSSLTQH
jgi:hypothetical protein